MQPSPHSTGSQPTLEIGLLNNLSDAGLEGGERQFADLIEQACGPLSVRLRLFALPQIERGAPALARLATAYGGIEALKQARLDGLIVTGCEPRAARLRDEAFWSGLSEVIEWARDGTRSTIWSCLAAHAAVLHLDGIERRRLPAKCSGVYMVDRVADHPLLAGAGDSFAVPHSRYNDIAERDLVANGYQILTRSSAIGVDAFVKSYRSQFVFLQGHPEYDADALRREYRRDVVRYRDGVVPDHPNLPENYFEPETEAALRTRAAIARDDRTTAVSGIDRRGVRAWRNGLAPTLFGNWLHGLAAKAAVRAA